MTTASTPSGITADGYAQKLFTSALGAREILSAYVGDRLGWYRSLATDGPASSVELTARTSTQERVLPGMAGDASPISVREVPGRAAAPRPARSMGQVGSASDNAAMDSFFGLLQNDVLGRLTPMVRDIMTTNQAQASTQPPTSSCGQTRT